MAAHSFSFALNELELYFQKQVKTVNERSVMRYDSSPDGNDKLCVDLDGHTVSVEISHMDIHMFPRLAASKLNELLKKLVNLDTILYHQQFLEEG